MRFVFSFLLFALMLVACSPQVKKGVVEENTVIPPIYSAPVSQAKMLELINQARNQARYCGDVYFEAVPALSYNPILSEAAKLHARDMSQYSFFSHAGSDGSDVAVRVNKFGYDWLRVGENLAYGSKGVYSEAQIVEGWLNSPGHCKNIMNSAFKEIGLDKVSAAYDYWVQVFALPKNRF